MGFNKLYLTKELLKSLYEQGGWELILERVRRADSIISDSDLDITSLINSTEREKQINKILGNE